MTIPARRPRVAVVNSSADLVHMLAMILDDAGFETMTLVSSQREAPEKERAFLRLHRPDAVVFAVSPPYDGGWATFLTLRGEMPAFGWVVTTTNKQALEQWVGPTDAIELIGKPFDLDEIVAALQRVTAPAAEAP